jgi:mannose-6-phosphate isomerase-like protein (cupin superfamily)
MHQLIILLLTIAAAAPTKAATSTEIKLVSTEKPFVSDDGSVIRTMPHMGQTESVHCLLPKGGVIQASRHKTVEQIWYVTSGEGEIWLKDLNGVESVIQLRKGTGLTVPLGFAFQFRNTGVIDLEIFIVNTTPWSGAGELIPVKNHWAKP